MPFHTKTAVFVMFSIETSKCLNYFFSLFKIHMSRHCNTESFQIPTSKESTCQCRRLGRLCFNPWVGKIPWSRKWQSTPLFLPRKFHGQRSLGGYSPWDHKESDTTEYANTHSNGHFQGHNTRAFTH